MSQLSSSTDLVPLNHDRDNSFKGYTVDELRYRRAVADLKRTLIGEKITSDLAKIQNRNIFSSGKAADSKWDKVGFVAGKLIGGLNYLDYVTIGLSLFGAGKKVVSLFNKKKKK